MARPGVTYTDVAKAAETIRRQGHNPTGERVRNLLGTGSASTIGPFLKRWKSEEGEGADTGGLPGDVLVAVKAVYDRLQQVADEKIKHAEGEYRSLEAALQQQMSQAEGSINQLQTRCNDLEKHVVTLQKEKNTLHTDIEDKRVKTAKLEAMLTTSVSQLSEAKNTILEQKQEMAQIRAHFEHYQASVAEDRQQEREQARFIKTQLDGRIQELSQQIKDESSRYRALDTAKQERERDLIHLRAEHEKVTEDRRDCKLEMARKKDTVKRLNSEAIVLREQASELETRCKTTSEENAGLVIANRLLEQNAVNLNKQVSEANDKIRLLTEEHRIVTQEKGALLGQLKQIQSTL